MSKVEARLSSLFEEMERDLGFSGAVLISQKGQTVFERAYGLASRQLNVPNTVDTRFHIASLTKMFIAMAALTLVERGRIELDQRPAKYLPFLSSLDERITMHHLLAHTSGVAAVYDDSPNPRLEALKAKNDGIGLLAYLAGQRQIFGPATGGRTAVPAICLSALSWNRSRGPPLTCSSATLSSRRSA